MTGPEHYREAKKHLADAAGIETDGHDDSTSAWHQRQAQVHATLAAAAATAEAFTPFDRNNQIWREALR
jgi:hypothetical protein